jgi:hypothetical protein
MNAYRHIYENLQENIPVPAVFRNKRTEVIFIDLGEQVENQTDDEQSKNKTERFLARFAGSLSEDFPKLDRSDLGEDVPRLDFD